MAFASGSGVRVAYVPEAEFGKTPATPSFQTFRATGGNLRTTKATGTSNERRPDRNVVDEFKLGSDVTGSYQAELTYGTFDAILAALLFGTWTADVVKNGVARQSFSFEETRTIGENESISRFRGVMVSSAAFTIGARAAVTISFDLMGIQETLHEEVLAGATYADATTTPVSTASANVAQLVVAGIATPPKVRSLALNITNNLRTRPVVGSEFSEEFGEGRCEVSGTLECYFQNNALYQKVLDHGSGALSFVVGNAQGQRYRIKLGKIIFGDGAVTAGGNSDDVMVSIPMRAVLDAASGCTIEIERNVELAG